MPRQLATKHKEPVGIAEMKEICSDLKREHEALDDIVADIDDAFWDMPTPAAGWSVRDEISHLAFFDEKARIAVDDPEAFSSYLHEIMNNMNGFAGQDVQTGRSMTPSALKIWWRKERKALVHALEHREPRDRVPWYGPSMSARSHATARLMETWAHGQDIADALGIHRKATDRLKHIAHLGFTTFGWSFLNHQMEVPENMVRLELTSPSGKLWVWGPETAINHVKGSAEDFCLVVTQRRNIMDTNLETTGDTASRWMSVAQCFAGPGTIGPKPGAFPAKTGKEL